MSEEIAFYTNPMSRGRTVRWMLEEVGQPYRTEVMTYGPTMKTPAFLAVNPMGKVPAIVHGKTVVTECAAICAYLADAFPEAGLAPPLADRGAYYRWLFFAAGPLEAAWTNKSFGFEAPKDKEGMLGYGSLERVLGVLETVLTGRQFIAGDRFSAADVYVGSQLNFGLMFGMIEKRAAFTAYVDALMARPAAARSKEADDALMPAA